MTDWGWATVGLFLVGFVEAEVWTGVFWGELEMGGDEVGAALALSLVEVEAVIIPVAATAAAREELGGEVTVAGLDMAGGEIAFGAKAPGICFFELRLLWGGVALRWAGVPAGSCVKMRT